MGHFAQHAWRTLLTRCLHAWRTLLTHTLTATLLYGLLGCSNLQVLSLDIAAVHATDNVHHALAELLSSIRELKHLTLSSILFPCDKLRVLSNVLKRLPRLTVFAPLDVLSYDSPAGDTVV